MSSRSRALTLALSLALFAAVVPVSSAAPPTSPDCVGLVAGSTGVIEIGGSVPSPEQLQGKPGGFGAVAPADVARTLPDAVTFKSSTETSSLEYVFALRARHLYVRRALVGKGLVGQPWYRLELPACLDGHVRSVSADGRLLIVIADTGQLYVHDMPGGDLSPERWTWRWGSYFWTGQGLTMPTDVRTFAASEETSGEHFTDTSGRERTPLGVATMYLLRGDGRTITYLDPWLPVDDSREVCGPLRGTLPLVALSGSGSTVLVEDRQGGLWTRMWDFDVSGANTVFGTYSWQRGRPAADTAWQLPGPDWVRQPLPSGSTTDRLSIVKDGLAGTDRILRVGGRSGTRTGYWEKRISASAWHFVATGQAPLGKTVSRAPVKPSWADDHRYVGTIGGAAVTASDVNPVCSPVHLRVDVAPGDHLDLLLHLGDGMRQETRARGLDDTPREYNAAIEVPQATFDHLDAAARNWVQTNLGGKQIAPSPVALTATRLRFLTTCWQLTLNGAPARMDVPRVPPDLGMVVGRMTELRQDGLTPTVCP